MKRAVLAALLGLLLLGACGKTAQPPVLTDQDNGRTLTLKPGQVLVIHLPANPTTGYTWMLAEVDDTVLQAAGEAGYTPAPGSQEQVGSGGTAAWRFVAVGTGTTTLKLVYARPWEKPPKPVQTFTVTVTVKP